MAAAAGAGGMARVDSVEVDFIEDGVARTGRGERIGSGSGGRVFEFLDSVLKVTKEGDVAEAMRLTADEIAKLTEAGGIANAIQLKSPDIIRTRDGSPALLMEKAVGFPLNDLIRYGALKEQDICNIAKALVDTVLDLDKKQIFHGDIKPANLIYDSLTGRLQVLDWALLAPKGHYASGLSEGDRYDKFTPGYRPPGWIQGQMPRYPDLWSVACTIVEAATGRALFRYKVREGDEANQVLMAVICHVLEVPPPPGFFDANPVGNRAIFGGFVSRLEFWPLLQLREVIDDLPKDLRPFIKAVLTLKDSPTLEVLRELPGMRNTLTFFYQAPAADQRISEMRLFVDRVGVWTAPEEGTAGARYQIPAAGKYVAQWLQDGTRGEQALAIKELACLSFAGRWVVRTPDGAYLAPPTGCAVS